MYVVVSLSRTIPRNQNYILYFENYSIALNLLTFLAFEGIHSLGTVRRNRINNCKLPNECHIKEEDRGKSYEHVVFQDGINISS